MGIAKFVGGAVASILVQQVVEDWLNGTKATEAAQMLFHQAILDEQGRVPAERRLTEEAGLRFAVTPLHLSDEVRGPVHFIEATNTLIDGNKPERTRHFCHNGVNQEFRLTGPRSALSGGEPAVCKLSRVTDPNPASVVTEPSDWFVHRTMASPHLYVPFYGMYKIVSDTKQNRRAADLVTSAFRQECVSSQGRVIADDSPVTVGDLSFWVTPLRSTGGSGRVIFHHVLVVNTAAAKNHPLRVLTLLHSAITGELMWLA
ncbi:hypothetical protein [Streptomyces lunaelactis]|uniref:hypothetical protein n=1 Tax=Streptomyces lunaelactis TaxID=1535768 RepID=UPI0015850B0B|nr:hypothetical protein [Streptomyces lunaelactis]NUK05659.1 hypothetical protein [Streptomyces lunaelactis]